MDKIFEFNSVDSSGRWLEEAIDLTPRGGGLEKIAGKRHPEIEAFLRTLRPDPAYQYVLMTPLGSYEYWGQNSNGDIMPEGTLSHNWLVSDPLEVIRAAEAKFLTPHGKRLPQGSYKEFGYKTFLRARSFLHHQNKNPEIAYGDMPCAVWNRDMHRVELIVRHDREKAKRVGAGQVVADIDAGKPRQISMGLKTPWDVCTICGNIARVPAEYCDHIRLMAGQTLQDGRLVAMVNIFMRFFDLSDVIIPAAKESAVIQKVASHGAGKVAAEKNAEIEKEVLPNTTSVDIVKGTECSEPEIPRSVLGKAELGSLLSTLAAMGIILKPLEFQTAMLDQAGRQDLSGMLLSTRQCFDPLPWGGQDVRFGSPDFSLARELTSWLASRSMLNPYIPRRVQVTVLCGAQPSRPITVVGGNPVLTKVAEAYSAYRAAFRNLPGLLDVAVRADPQYYQNNFFGDPLSEVFEKVSGSTVPFSGIPLTSIYAYNAGREDFVDPPRGWDMDAPQRVIRTLLHQ